MEGIMSEKIALCYAALATFIIDPDTGKTTVEYTVLDASEPEESTGVWVDPETGNEYGEPNNLDEDELEKVEVAIRDFAGAYTANQEIDLPVDAKPARRSYEPKVIED